MAALHTRMPSGPGEEGGIAKSKEVAETVSIDSAKADNTTTKISALGRPTTTELHEIAQRIRSKVESCCSDILAIGKDLIDVKERLEHGEFGIWIRSEFGWTQRTAQNYMAAAVAFGGKAKHVSHLPVATIYKLASPSATAARDQVVERLEAGEQLHVKEIDAICREVKAQDASTRTKAKARAERKKRQHVDLVSMREGFALELAKLNAPDWATEIELLKERVIELTRPQPKLATSAPVSAPEDFPELPEFLDRRSKR